MEVLYNAGVRLLTLGGLRLEGSDFTRSKPLLLLCYLALEGVQSRRVLAELFFGDASHPRDALSTTFRRLRASSDDLVEADGDRIAAGVACDAVELLAELDAGHDQDALERYRGAFLEGLDVPLGEELEEWVFATREYLASRMREACLADGEALLAEGRREDATRRAEAAYRLSGAPELEPEEFGRVHRLLAASRSPLAADVRAEAEGYGIEIADLPDAGATSSPHNLPAPTDAFVGRDPELLELARMLSGTDIRLITLHGSGGVGKSRLALQTAQQQTREGTFLGGIFFVPLDALTAAEQIAGSVAQVLGLLLDPSPAPLDQIAARIGGGRTLLILDNIEHLLDGAEMLSSLLRACPNLTLFVTSRERLHLAEEHVLTLTGLPLPAAGMPIEQSVYTDAVQLFVQRAKKASLGFVIDDEALTRIVELVRLVEGFPLAIELAAAWVRTLPLSEIIAELGTTMDLLTSTDRNVVDRHRSIRATFEHSWQLLGERERGALVRLSAFRGGFRRDAASAVAGATLTSLVGLVDRSLLVALASGRFDRHALLYQYAREKLDALPDVRREVFGSHLTYYVELAQEAGTHLRGEGQRRWLERLGEEHDNLRAALQRSLELDRVDEGLKLADVLGEFWRVRGHFLEGRTLLERVLAHPGAGRRTTLRAMVLNRVGSLAQGLGDYDEADASFEEGLALFREAGDRRGIALSLGDLGTGAMRRGDYATALARHDEALALWRELGDGRGIASGLLNMGNAVLYVGNYDKARSLYAESADFYEASGDDVALAVALGNLGLVESWRGNYAAARPYYERALTLRRELGDRPGIAWSLNDLGLIAYHLGAYDAARDRFEESLSLKRELGDRKGIAWSLANLGLVAHHTGDHGEARRFHQESLSLKKELGDRYGIASSLSNLGEVAAATGDLEGAQDLHREGLTIFREIGHKRGIVSSLINLGGAALEMHRVEEAVEHLDESLVLARELGDRLGLAQCLEGLALARSLQGAFGTAALLWGAAEALRERIESPLSLAARKELDAAIERTRRAFGPDPFIGAWERGRGAELDEVIASARSATPPRIEGDAVRER